MFYQGFLSRGGGAPAPSPCYECSHGGNMAFSVVFLKGKFYVETAEIRS